MYLHIDDLTKTIKRKTVLDHVIMGFERGRVYGITGANGSGKTMLLRAICGFIRPDAGTVSIDGRRVDFNQRLPENIGLIIETPGFVNSQSAMTNLRYLAGINDAFDAKETDRLLTAFGLASHRDAKVKSFSLGMRQKLAIVQALMEHQRLILLDEPTNGLDWRSVREFMAEIKRQRDQGHTIIIASHHTDELAHLADEIHVMEAGRITGLWQGPVDSDDGWPAAPLG